MSESTRSAANGQAVTKSDTTTYSGMRGLYVGGAGNVALMAPGASAAVTFTAVPAGTVLPVQAVKVMSTNTTAPALVALF